MREALFLLNFFRNIRQLTEDFGINSEKDVIV